MSVAVGLSGLLPSKFGDGDIITPANPAAVIRSLPSLPSPRVIHSFNDLTEEEKIIEHLTCLCRGEQAYEGGIKTLNTNVTGGYDGGLSAVKLVSTLCAGFIVCPVLCSSASLLLNNLLVDNNR